MRQRVYRQSFKSSIFMNTSNLLTHELPHVSPLPSTMSTISKSSPQVSSWSSPPSLGVQYRMEYFSLGGGYTYAWDCAPFIFGCSFLLMNTIPLLPIVNLCILHLIFHVGENNTVSKVVYKFVFCRINSRVGECHYIHIWFLNIFLRFKLLNACQYQC